MAASSLLTSDELAAELKYHRHTVVRLTREGRIPTRRVGRFWRYDLDEVLAAMDRNVPAATPASSVTPDFDALP